MLKLGVNIDHVATVRQARYRNSEQGEPSPVQAALACEQAGCYGITAHLREDRRHILDRDIWSLKEALKIPLNFEMANTSEMVGIAIKLLPASVCLVPEKREELTTEGGLDVVSNLSSISETTKRLQDLGIEVSLFIDPDPKQIEASAQATAQAVELHTGAFAEAFSEAAPGSSEIQRLTEVATQGHDLGLKINAGHGLNYENIREIHQVPHLCELNIGHNIVSRAITIGLAPAVSEMLNLIRQ
jgi:pyridoxine 5-phosphate synthase